MQKHYLAFVTLAFSVFVWLLIRNEEWLTGGVMGLSDIGRPSLFGVSLRPALYFYWFTLAIAAALTFAMWWLGNEGYSYRRAGGLAATRSRCAVPDAA